LTLGDPIGLGPQDTADDVEDASHILSEFHPSLSFAIRPVCLLSLPAIVSPIWSDEQGRPVLGEATSR
jgi:hypothetical protein